MASSNVLDPDYDPKAPVTGKAQTNNRKGKAFESRLVKLFNAWAPAFSFQRVPSSGGMKWGQAEGLKGDITALGFPFCIEAKNYSDATPVYTTKHNIIRLSTHSTKAMVQSWGDAGRVKKIPILMRNYNHKIHLMIPIKMRNMTPEVEAFILATGSIIWMTYEGVSQPIYACPDFTKFTKTTPYTTFWENLQHIGLYPHLERGGTLE